MFQQQQGIVPSLTNNIGGLGTPNNNSGQGDLFSKPVTPSNPKNTSAFVATGGLAARLTIN